MRKELLLLGAFGMLTTATLCAQEFHLQPTPQEYITQKDFTITDKWKLSACNEPSVLNLMTCCEVEIDRNKNITLTGEAGRFKVEYDKKLLSPATDTVELTDPKLIHSWKRKKLTRIRFTIVSQQISGESKLVIRKVQYHKTLND
jgi:hypothetical protein